MSEVIDSFGALLGNRAARAEQVEPSREDSLKKERRRARLDRQKREGNTQKTPKQLQRRAVRTSNISFRCSPDFHELVRSISKNEGRSIADVLEEALNLYAEQRDD